VVAFVALLLVPPALAVAALIAATLAVGVGQALRTVRARQDRRAAAAADATVLGSDESGNQVVLSDRQLSAHGLILGASGAGKSTTLLRILSDHIARGVPVVAIDMKGSPAFARQLAEAAHAAGRPFRLWTADGPGFWNPLQYGNPTELKDKLIATERFTEPHYQRAAERYLQSALQVLHHSQPQRAPTLEEVVAAMDPRRLASALRDSPRPLRERVQDYLAGLTPDQLSAVRGLQTRLGIITDSHTGAYLSPAPAAGAAEYVVDVRGALAGSTVVVFSLNSSTYGRLAAQIGTLVVQDLVCAVGARLTERPERSFDRATVGIDEFSALAADHVIALLARGREAGVATVLATQELADLDRAAPGLRDQVLGNTAVKIAHRQEVPASAQAVAQMAGTEKTWEETRQIGGPLIGRYETGRGTRREVEQFIVDPNHIKNLRTGDAVLISKLAGRRPRTVRVARAARPLTPDLRGAPHRDSSDRGH
jgi:type IV secretory pathway TraG/TraD family ATPase VirD4